MTTPAVSIQRDKMVPPYTQVVTNYGSTVKPPVSHPPKSIERYDEYRPVSVFSKPTASGWRNPTRFWHYGSHSTPRPIGAFAMNDKTPNPFSYIIQGDGGGWNATVYGLQGTPNYLKDVAISKALLGLKDQKFNLGQFFREREQLVGLTYDAAQGCVNLINEFLNYKRGFSRKRLMALTLRKIRRFPRTRNTQDLLSKFLAVQYGVRPLMQDVYGAADMLNKRERDNDAYRATVHGRTGENFDLNWWKASDYASDFGYDCRVHETHRVHVRLDYCLDNPLLASLSQLGITNPVDLEWELIPFSFVVDWFLPIGNYLQCFDAAVGWSFKGGSLSTISRNTVDSPVPTWRGDRWKFKLLLSSSPYKESNYHFERYPFLSSPLPQVPRFKNPLSGQHIANAIALIFANIRT